MYSPDAFPQNTRKTARNLARVHIERQNWNAAYSALDRAIQAAQRLYTAALTEEGKTAEIEENARLYQQMVDVCLRLPSPPPAGEGRPVEAFLYAEEGRSRLLRDQLGALPLPPPPNVPGDLIAQESALLQEERNWENALRSAPDEPTRLRWRDEYVVTRAKLNDLWDRLIRDYDAEDYVALRRGERFTWERVQAWLGEQKGNAALLEFFTLEDRLAAFIVRAGETQPRVAVLAISPRRLVDFTNRFFREVHRFDRHAPRFETWRGLGPLLLNEVMPHLNDAELVYIIPHGVLHYLPLHALEYMGKPLIEHFPIAYAPSAAVAMRTSLHPHPGSPLPAREGRGALVVGNPTGDLRFAEQEARQIAQRFDVPPLLRDAATKARVLSELASTSWVHLSTHAYFHASEPFESGILFAPDPQHPEMNEKLPDGTVAAVLHAREVLQLSLQARLVVVSACQTAMQDIRTGDELLGLTRAFLYAGVPSLVLSLWAVDDAATASLMTRFYHHLYDSNGTLKPLTTAEALRAAMLETRAERPHTYYWAPFMLIGDWR